MNFIATTHNNTNKYIHKYHKLHIATLPKSKSCAG